MKLLLHFMKPYWKLSVITIIVVLLDSVAAMFIPTITARIVTIGTSGGTLDEMITMGIIMLVVAALSGFGALLGCVQSCRQRSAGISAMPSMINRSNFPPRISRSSAPAP